MNGKTLSRRLTASPWIASAALASAALIVGCTGTASPHPPESSSSALKTQPSETPSKSPDGSVSPGDSATIGSTLALEANGPPPTPEQVKAAWTQGVSLYESGRYEEAVGPLETTASARRKDAYVHYLLGLSLWKSGRADAAQEALERAVGLAPDSARTWINLARVRMETGDPAGALEAASSVLAINPSSAQGLHQQGRALASLGRIDEALESLRQGVEEDPDNGYIANTLGYVLIRAGHADEAIPILEMAREKLPKVAYLHNNLAVAYERTGRRPEAIEEYRAAVEAGDSGGKASASLARLQPGPGPQADRSLDAKAEPSVQSGLPVARSMDGDGSSSQDSPHKH